MPYSELIKNFSRIREYMRQFYVYGFRRRDEYTKLSPRSYDNERRRIESWLGDYMSFRQNSDGRQVFLSVDSRAIPVNPLYQAFKAKSFTAGDVTFHFYVLDLLADGTQMSLSQIANALMTRYLSAFDEVEPLEESTLRKKLKEYVSLGLLTQSRRGRETVYARAEDAVDLESWRDALDFYTESDSLGVIGSYLLDKLPKGESPFGFKHHYILHALDSEVLCALLTAIGEQRAVDLNVLSPRNRSGLERAHTVCPLKVFVSTQSGREYLLCYHYKFRRPMFFRLDTIRSVKAGAIEKDYARYAGYGVKLRENLWGTSMNQEFTLDHIEMDIAVAPDEGFIVDRLYREKRCGTVEHVSEGVWRFSADVYDASEMLPWLRTFTGRILDLRCSSRYVQDRFYHDLDEVMAMYGGEDDAVQ